MAVIQFAGDGEGEGNGQPNQDPPSNISKPTNRQRWATQRLRSKGAIKKRVSIMDRFHRRRVSNVEKRASAGTASTQGQSDNASAEGNERAEQRRIYFNIPIPDSERDEDGNLKIQYPRNKIRTSKYTPLTFIPKNLWLQFHTIANIYFLFVIVLQFFPIFGANNPGLSAVPLIAIVTMTGVKDAVEDWQRTVLDNELNNSPVYRLVGWNNVNSTEDKVSMWRRFKKACTRTIISTYRALKSFRQKKNADEDADNNEDERRISMVTTRNSVLTHRESYLSTNDRNYNAIPMTAVRSPDVNPRHSHGEGWPLSDVNPQPDTSVRDSEPVGAKARGTIFDQSRPSPGNARFKRDFWKNVQVGDFIRLYNGDQIPADVVILSTSDADGACYVETKNLDGETNLKVRQALHCGRLVKHARDCEKTEFVVESEAPHPNLYAYSAAIRWQQRNPRDPEAPPQEMVEPITINNLLLRGCSLQNTEWILGVVIFTGAESKIMLNSGATPSKRPRIVRELNWKVIYNFIILFIMCLLGGLINGFAWADPKGSLLYFEYGSYGGSAPVEGLVGFWVGVVLFQNLVPISLYISLEIIHAAQAIFIYFDLYMYYDKLQMACVPKSWNISDDVGQIEYIFSDKTGTLTQNVMEFKKCTINGIAYGEAYTEAQLGMQRREGLNVEEEAAKARQRIDEGRMQMLQMLRKLHDNPYLKDEQLTFIAPNFASDLHGGSGESQKLATENFMVALALCHTVITEHTPGDPPQIEFKAQSPDEAALVSTARDCGFTVLGRSSDDLILNVMGEERTYTVLNTLEFNSTRKRMSAIIRMPDGTIRLFCKGADSIIYSRLAHGQQQELRKTTAEHLEMFAREGLRTLCVAERVLGEAEYQEWSRTHDIAAAALVDREEKLEETASAIEQELILLGGTAIEDRLQDGVPDTISLLADAGIKLWVLTGDKVETAINIGFSCNLLNNNMELLVFSVPTDELEIAAAQLNSKLESFGITGSDDELLAARQDHRPPPPTHAVVIDGDTLKLMLNNSLKQKFLLLCKQCKAVLCCRVSPAQKAAVVRMVKNGLNIMALSIGDGANDVAMIQEADVGVGIAGEEGRQAVMSADYAIGQFRFLQRLILVHGRWCYRRLGETIANFFYKTLVWTFALFWYSIYNNFDGSYLFEYTYIILINVVFTSLPVIFMGIFDQDVDDKVSLAVPQLYMRGIERKEWSSLKFWLYMFDGFYQSLMCFFMPYLLYSVANFQRENGLGIDDRNRIGVLVGSCAVIASNTYILLNTFRWDWLTVLINAFSSLLIFFWTGVYSAVTSSQFFYQAAPEVYGALVFWVVLLITVMICLLPRFMIKSIQKVFFPRDVDIIREQVVLGQYKYLDQFEAYVPPKSTEVIAVPTRSDASATSSDLSKPIQPAMKRDPMTQDDEWPIYSPSAAPMMATHNPRNQSGSNGTNYTNSIDFGLQRRPSWDHTTSDRNRFSGNSSEDHGGFLDRVESTNALPQCPHSPLRIPSDPTTFPV